MYKLPWWKHSANGIIEKFENTQIQISWNQINNFKWNANFHWSKLQRGWCLWICMYLSWKLKLKIINQPNSDVGLSILVSIPISFDRKYQLKTLHKIALLQQQTCTNEWWLYVIRVNQIGVLALRLLACGLSLQTQCELRKYDY